MWTPPSSTIRRASAAYSSGVYGIAGHWSRLAIAPEIAQVMTTGSVSMDPQTGTTPFRFHGRSTRLPAASSSARQIVARVSRGSITSSIMSLPAAT